MSARLDEWPIAPLGDLVTVRKRPKGFTPSEKETFLPMGLIPDDAVEVASYETRPREKLTSTYFEEGDLLVSRITPCFENGKQAIPISVPGGYGFATTEVYPLVCGPMVDPRFLYWCLKDATVRGSLIGQMEGATGRMRLPQAALLALRIPVPSLDEQRAIVVAVEDAFAQIGSIEEDLNGVDSLLANLARSCLRDAVTPGGTSGEGPEHQPWASVTPPDIASSVPNALCIGPFGSNLKVSDYTESGVPLVFVRNIRSGTFSGIDLRYVSADKADELASHRVEGGDLLVTKMGDPPGDVARYPDHAPGAIITADCIRFAVDPALADPQFVEIALRSPQVRQQITQLARGVAQQKISLKSFKTVTLPLPPRSVQQRIVAALRQREAAQDAIAEAVVTARRQLAQMRQSILHRAMSSGAAALVAGPEAPRVLSAGGVQ